MPELPEVEHIRQTLLPLKNKTISKTVLQRKNLRYPIPFEFSQTNFSFTITKLARHGKYLLLFDKSQQAIIEIHLGMSGALLLKPTYYALKKHDHVCFQFNTSDTKLIYNDPRRFGFILHHPNTDLSQLLSQRNKDKSYDGLNRSPAAKEAFMHKVSKSSRPIVSILLDQNTIAGLGNIYVNELCFMCGVHPKAKGHSLTKKTLTAMFDKIEPLLQAAIHYGGTYLNDYKDANNEPGAFQNFLSVYGKHNTVCPNCKTTIMKDKLSGRSFFYCTTCQKL